ncbi:MAG: glycosyltransferase family 4 protein [Planctomycetota bacterium]
MRVLVVSLRYPPYVAGGYELSAAETVAEFRARGHDVHVLCARGVRLAEADVRLHPVLDPDLDDGDPWQRALAAGNLEKVRRHLYDPRNARRSAEVLRSVRPDVVVAYNLALLSLAPLRAAQRVGVPALCVVNDRWPRNHWLETWPAGAKPLRRATIAGAWRRLVAGTEFGPMVVPSESLARELRGAGLQGVEVLRLPLPVDLVESCARERSRPRREGEPLRVVCTSMLWHGKGQHVLLEALALARSRGARVELEIAGHGDAEYEARLRARAAAEDLAGGVTFVGMLPRDAMGALLARAHVLALPSLWGEPYGLATLEAMAHGLAPVVTDDGASPEIVRDGVDGLVVPKDDAAALADALAKLASDEALRARLAASSVERVATTFAPGPYYDALAHRVERRVEEARR